MGTPKGMRSVPTRLSTGDLVLVYSNPSQILLQVRRQIPTELDLLTTSFKIAVALQPAEAAAIASELLRAAHHCGGGRKPQAAASPIRQAAADQEIVPFTEPRRSPHP
jgi:hypothetical protein